MIIPLKDAILAVKIVLHSLEEHQDDGNFEQDTDMLIAYIKRTLEDKELKNVRTTP